MGRTIFQKSNRTWKWEKERLGNLYKNKEIILEQRQNSKNIETR